ncbi:MAG: hypothetical protein AAF198_13675 [Pseudomonadota bacterium]
MTNPDPFSWYEFFEDFQTGLAGLLGFVGVMITLWWNARLSRKQQERETSLQAQAVRQAILAELIRYRNAYKTQSELESLVTTKVPRLKRDVSEPLMGQIGVLANEGIDINVVLNALGIIDATEKKMHLISIEVSPEFFTIQPREIPAFRGMIQKMAKAVGPAIEELTEPRSAKR